MEPGAGISHWGLGLVTEPCARSRRRWTSIWLDGLRGRMPDGFLRCGGMPVCSVRDRRIRTGEAALNYIGARHRPHRTTGQRGRRRRRDSRRAGGPSRFEGAKKVIAFAGIDASKIQSGGSEEAESHMPKRGSSHLGCSLLMAADAARRPDPCYGGCCDSMHAATRRCRGSPASWPSGAVRLEGRQALREPPVGAVARGVTLPPCAKLLLLAPRGSGYVRPFVGFATMGNSA